jgi:[acyl-carrier-protein] S-malonyltransferase
MDKRAAIFPGQGSQKVGMGKDLYEAFDAAREAFDEANEILGFDLKSVCFEGPDEKLVQTRYTQPAIVAHSIAAWRLIASGGFRPDYVAGHSVGEYAALVAGGVLTYAGALRLVKVRAEAMQNCGEENPGTMAAIIGMPEERLSDLLEGARAAGVIEAANFNSPGQTVVSGDIAAVTRATEIAPGLGAKRAVRLNVSAAFHSPLMEKSVADLSAMVGQVEFRPASVPVVCNVTARPGTDPVEIRELLKKQLLSPVLWQQSMQFMIREGVKNFVEVGPGNVLCGLLRRIDRSADCASCSDVKTVNEFLGGIAV